MEMLNLGTDAIIGSNPSGIDVRVSDIYEQLTQEVDKRNNLSASGAIDWSKVVTLSSEILANHSKDLLVCSYLTIGLLNTDGVKGLFSGVQIYRDLILYFWDKGLFPLRPNGRLNAIAWWVENTTATIHKLNTNNVCSDEDRAQLTQNFDDIINFFDTHSITGIDELYPLKNACLQVINVVTSESASLAHDDSSNVNQPSTVIETTQTTHYSPPVINDFAIENVDKLLETTLINLTKLSGVLANEQPFSYKVFKINRFVAWLDINVLPICDDELKTMLPPPDESLQSSIQMNYLSNNWIEVIKLAESRVVDLRFWLDLSYYVYQALKSMNQMVAASEVGCAVLAFTRRLAGVEKLLFSDGTPFATADTQNWLISLAAAGTANTNLSTNYAHSDADSSTLCQELDYANELLAENQLTAAINYLHETVQLSANGKMKLLRIVQFCQFCAIAGQIRLTSSYIKDLLTMVRNHQLDKWDPQLAGEVFKMALELGQHKSVNLESNILADALASLTLINPTMALNYYE